MGLSQIEIKPHDLTYCDGPFGSRAFRAAFAEYFNRRFNPVKPVAPEHLIAASGVSAVLDMTTYVLTDEGDGILIGRPLYTGFSGDLTARSKAKLVPVSSGREDPMGESMVQKYEEELLRQEEAGTKIKAIILCR